MFPTSSISRSDAFALFVVGNRGADQGGVERVIVPTSQAIISAPPVDKTRRLPASNNAIGVLPGTPYLVTTRRVVKGRQRNDKEYHIWKTKHTFVIELRQS